ncbi:hypothetical protein [Cerasicoccus fimbriatus]|uniref:hypothetical protein n=1 Tax=Cerasicoccus fimbriatus TaxID=3014554 RepID=UPI0022B3E641|nr:hypothetical protein [Cerasicoccus sp. TK19100]
MSDTTTISKLRQRLVANSLPDQWWMASNGTTEPQPLSLQTIEQSFRDNPQGNIQVCHVEDDASAPSSWHKITYASPERQVETRGHMTVFRSGAVNASRKLSLKRESADSATPFEDALAGIVKANQFISSQIRDLRQQIYGLEMRLDAIKEANAQAKKFDERERAIRELEEEIYDKASALEQERIELNQLREELDRRHFHPESA